MVEDKLATENEKNVDSSADCEKGDSSLVTRCELIR